jgi:hypothetical protein
MIPDWASAVVAKAKVAGLLGAALAAGGVGGSVALSHVTPTSQQVVTSAASTSSDPETADVTSDPESTQAQDPQTTDTQTATPAACPTDVKNHGAYVSSVARSAAHGKDGDHGTTASAAAKSDCGKPAQSGDAQSGDDQSGEGESPDPESSGATPAHPTPTHPTAPSEHGKGHTH